MITFDPINKIITLDSFNVSASQIWSRWIDWFADSDNFKYLPAMSQIGGVAPVALYLYLENGWTVRPMEDNGLTIVTGNLLVQGGGNPFIPTIGNYSSQIFLETPISAQAIEVHSGSGLSQSEHDKLFELDTNSVNIKKVNDIDVDGTGTDTDPWGPV